MSEKVIVAIPAYNAGENLLNLVEQVNEQDFDAVFVLDDYSTDDSIKELKEAYPHFNVISGQENKGPGGNRNRLLDVVEDELIVFIDADMTLETDNIKEPVKNAIGKISVGMAGGYILNTERYPMAWNYGFEMHPRKDSWFWQIFTTINRGDISTEYRNELLQQLREADTDFHWVHPDSLPLRSREVDWVAEGLFAIRAEVLRRVGGYDENMRYHEGQDLARRVRDEGFEVMFTPGFSAMHHNIEVRGERRDDDFREGQFYFFHKHWGMSRKVFDQLYS